MRKRVTALIALAAITATMAFTGVAQATTSDSCLDFGSGQNNCFAGTQEDHVNFGSLQFGLHTYGSFTLVCEKYDQVKFKQGRVAANGSRNFFVENLFGWHDPNCVLTAHGFSQRSGQVARVRVTLIS